MTRPKRWVLERIEDGVGTYELSSWRYFGDFINQRFLDYRQYVFRGHASDRWKLESSLDRALKRVPKSRRDDAPSQQLQNFRFAARGRRGANPRAIPEDSDDEWWALGQHQGLYTPLLDWTESPFVALYFAFAEVDTQGASHRAIWAVNGLAIETVRQHDPAYAETRVVRPFSDENARLVSQRALFVRCPPATALDDAIRAAFRGESTDCLLLCFRIPNRDRTVCLRSLNRMNINHLSLFPDLSGASVHCNTDLSIADY